MKNTIGMTILKEIGKSKSLSRDQACSDKKIVEIQSPYFGDLSIWNDIPDGTVTSWYKKPGEKCSRNECIADIKTDKTIFEVVAPEDGIITEILKTEGRSVLSNEILAKFLVSDVESSKKNDNPAHNIKNNPSKCVDLISEYNSNFEVIVLATMSAGKSTIINALIGTELLPSSNQACTARVFKIEDHDSMPYFEATVLNENNIGSYNWINACPETLKKINNSDEKGVIYIRGNIKSIHSQEHNLVIYDTPGPNNSQDNSHANLTRNILSDGNFGLVIYALNATQFGVEDDSKLLYQLFDLIGNDQEKKDVIFILNKSDELDDEQGEDLENIVEKVAIYLERHGFKSPKIIPLSAISALLARKIINNDPLTRKESRIYNDLIEHSKNSEKSLIDYASISEDVKKTLNYNFANSSDAHKLIDYSGIMAIEYFLQKKLNKSKKDMKNKTIVKLNETLNYIETLKSLMNK